MILSTALFVGLALIAVTSAGGVLLCRRVLHCGLCTLFCGLALAGLYLLLNMHLLAAVQLAVGVCLTGMVGAICLPLVEDHPKQEAGGARKGGPIWMALAGLPLAALTLWGIWGATISKPVLDLPPMWAVRGEHIWVLGRELLTRYLPVYALLGLLLFTAMVSVAHLIRQGRRPGAEESGP